MKKIIVVLALMAMVLFAGCSSDKPVITNIKETNVNYDSTTKMLTYTLEVDYAIDKSLKTATTGIMKVSFPGYDYNKELEWGFVAGQQNNKNKFGLSWDEYELGTEIKIKIEMIQGTQIIETKEYTFTYE